MEQKSQPSLNYTEVESRVFSVEKDGSIRIGGQPIPPELRDILRGQAKFIQSSQLWEILSASTLNEAVNLALIQSKDFDHVQFAKAMWHYSLFITKSVDSIAK